MYWLAIIFLSMVVIIILNACRIGKLDPLALPVIFALMFSFFYLWLPLSALNQGGLFDYITAKQIAWGILFPALTLIAFVFGWFANDRSFKLEINVSGIHKVKLTDAAVVNRIFNVGCALCVLSLSLWLYFLISNGGVTSFYQQAHGRAGNWESFTAYIYLSPNIAFPGLSFMLIAICKDTRRTRKYRFFFLCFALLLLFHSLLFSSRGLLFQFFVTIAGTVFLVKHYRPKLKVFLLGSFFIGIALLLVVNYRNALHIGTGIDDFKRIKIDGIGGIVTSLDNNNLDGVGNEFIYHAGLLATIDKLSRFGWGERYVHFIFIHPIPRVLWKSKPLRSYSLLETKNEIAGVLGWLPANGAAPTLVADMYAEWSFLSIIAWFSIGFLFNKSYRMATKIDATSMEIVFYVIILCRSIFLISQGLIPFLEVFPLMFVPSYVSWKLLVNMQSKY